MRSEKEMMELILNTAKDDARVRAVYMNGSRTNPEIPNDAYKDYDIVFIVSEVAPFVRNDKVIAHFGKPLIVEEPDFLDFGDDKSHVYSDGYIYLMLFTDGIRIDLQFLSKKRALKEYTEDTLTVPLLDKDGILPKIPATNDSIYHVKKPSEHKFQACCKDFFWCLNNVAKGIARDELPYSMVMLNCVVREKLHEMINYYIGAQNDFDVSPGKLGKFYKKFLPKELYELYKKTYSDSDYENVWNSVFAMCKLFRRCAASVAEKLSYSYNKVDDGNMILYLEKVKSGELYK